MGCRIAQLLVASALAAAAGIAAAAGPRAAPDAATQHEWNATFSFDSGLAGAPGDGGQTRLAHALQGSSLWNREPQHEDAAREGGHYSIVRLAASLAKALPSDFQVRAAVNGQLTRDAALPGARFAAFSGYALRRPGEGARRNDFGMAANVELYSPNLCLASALWQCRALLFYDKRYIKRNRELAGVLRNGSIGSVGVGFRMQISNNANLQFDYGRVLRSGLTEPDDKSRLHVRLGLAY